MSKYVNIEFLNEQVKRAASIHYFSMDEIEDAVMRSHEQCELPPSDPHVFMDMVRKKLRDGYEVQREKQAEKEMTYEKSYEQS